MQLYSEKRNKFSNNRKAEKKQNSIKKKIAATAVIMLICTGISLGFYRMQMFDSNIVMVYLTGTLVISYLAESYIFSIFTSICSVLLYNYFFTKPIFTLKVNDPNYLLTFFVMFLIGFITSMLTIRVKLERQQVTDREEYISKLYNIEKKLLNVKSRQELAQTAAEQFGAEFNANVMVKLVDSKGNEIYKFIKGSDVFHEELDAYACQEACRFGRTCGRGTDIYPGAKAYYKPFIDKGDVLGAMGVSTQNGLELNESQYKLIDVMVPQISVVLQREKNYEKQQKANLEIQKERLRIDMLRSISHDFRTPLAGVMGLASTAAENYSKMSDEDRIKYLQSIYENAEWLNELVENILQATQFDEGTMKLNIAEEAVEEIVEEASSIVKKHGDKNKITLNLPEEIVFVKVDGVLIRQVLVNLLNNAISYSPEGSEISLSVYCSDNKVFFEVKDNGPGISELDMPYVFDRYHRSSSTSIMNRKGLGLGLSLSKNIVEAHNGEISIRKNSPHGTIVSFYVPAEKEII